METVFDSQFGVRSFEQLNGSLKRIYTRPFFLSLALKCRLKFAGQSVWSGIFEEFFLTQLGMTDGQLDSIAEATLKAFDSDGSFDLAGFKERANGEIYQLLLGAEVLASDGSGFEHHLWRDYLVSRYLAQNKNEWKDTVFDAITTFASSLESLSLAVEQLRDRALKDEFLKAIYDWNYVAAANCIADFREDDPDSRQLSLGIRSAILAAIAEKRFDKVERTRQRANDILREHRYEFARPFIEAQTPDCLRQHVATLTGPENWFKKWKALFTKRSGQELTVEEIALVTSDDSLIGWTVANLARRSGLNEEGQGRIREIYRQAGNADDKKTVRWRAVHVLGAYPNESNVNLLLDAARHDPYHWVQYGAARGLIEIASQSEEDLRTRVLSDLDEFIRNYDPPNVWIRRQIRREIVEVAFIRNPQPGWKNVVRPNLTLIVEKEAGTLYQKELRKRVSDFRSYDEGE